jgi:hypothetical protein
LVGFRFGLLAFFCAGWEMATQSFTGGGGGSETQTSFSGSVSFPVQEDAKQFRVLINTFMDSSSKVFFEIEKVRRVLSRSFEKRLTLSCSATNVPHDAPG